MADASVRGRFVWHDLQTPNPAGSHEFYGKVLGWRKQPWEQDPAYLMFAAAGGPLGGAVEARTATPQWLPYIGTTDVDETAAAAAGLGGRVQTAPADLPNGGRYAVLVDPQGAAFGVHASSAHAPEQEPGAGEFSWHELATTVGPGDAFAFYASLFGWDELDRYDMGPMGFYLIFGRNGTQLGGMFDKSTQGKPGSAYWLGYVSVDDLEGTIERAKGARGSLLVGPMDVPGGDRIAQLMDPHGAFFALHRRAAAPAASKPSSSAATASSTKPKKPGAAKAQAPAAKKPAPKKQAAPAEKPAPKVRPAKKAKSNKKKPAARKAAKKKSPAKKSTPRKTAKNKGKPKAKARKRGR